MEPATRSVSSLLATPWSVGAAPETGDNSLEGWTDAIVANCDLTNDAPEQTTRVDLLTRAGSSRLIGKTDFVNVGGVAKMMIEKLPTRRSQYPRLLEPGKALWKLLAVDDRVEAHDVVLMAAALGAHVPRQPASGWPEERWAWPHFVDTIGSLTFKNKLSPCIDEWDESVSTGAALRVASVQRLLDQLAAMPGGFSAIGAGCLRSVGYSAPLIWGVAERMIRALGVEPDKSVLKWRLG